MSCRGSWLAVSAGSLAALASVFGKLGGAQPTSVPVFSSIYRLSCYALLILVSGLSKLSCRLVRLPQLS